MDFRFEPASLIRIPEEEPSSLSSLRERALFRYRICVSHLPAPFCNGTIRRMVGGGSSCVVYELEVEGRHLLLKCMDTLVQEYWKNLMFSSAKAMMLNEVAVMRAFTGTHGFLPLLAGGCFQWPDGSMTTLICMQRFTRLVKVMAEEDFTESQLLSLMEDFAKKIRVMHRRGFVHRDIKPENIFLQRDAENRWQTVVGDFGAALNAKDREAAARAPFIGTESYLPAEVGEWHRRGEYPLHLYELDTFAICASFIRLLGGIPRTASTSRTPRPAADSPVGMALESALELKTVDDLLAYIRRVQPGQRIVPGLLKRARDALLCGQANLQLETVYTLLLRGCDATAEGCERLYYFLQSEYSSSPKKKEEALASLQKLADEGDPIASGMYWLARLRRKDSSAEVLQGLEDSGWPIGLYISGRYKWINGGTVTVRSEGARLILEAAEQNLPEAQRVIANYALVYETDEVRGLRNYIPRFAGELEKQRSYFGYPIRKTLRDPHTRTNNRWTLWEMV